MKTDVTFTRTRSERSHESFAVHVNGEPTGHLGWHRKVGWTLSHKTLEALGMTHRVFPTQAEAEDAVRRAASR